jgi:aspartyl-tRNA(Asn)/glutamyl-tRNA(Gln) amidotransferase subunit C
MSLDATTVEKIAYLARIAVPEEKLQPLAGELSSILNWIEQLQEVDTTGVAPMSSVSDVTLPQRDDAVTDGNCVEKIMANAPSAEDDCFLVPRVVE